MTAPTTKILTCEGWYFVYEDGQFIEMGEGLEDFLIKKFNVDVDYDTAYHWEDPNNPPARIAS